MMMLLLVLKQLFLNSLQKVFLQLELRRAPANSLLADVVAGRFTTVATSTTTNDNNSSSSSDDSSNSDNSNNLRHHQQQQQQQQQISAILQKMVIAQTIKEQLAIVAITATALLLFKQLQSVITRVSLLVDDDHGS